MQDTTTDRTSSLRFADAARRIGAAARELDLAVPAFRCPPRLPGVARTIRRYPGGVVVSVRLTGRPFEAALADMVEGVLVANRIDASAASALRATLREAASPVPGRAAA